MCGIVGAVGKLDPREEKAFSLLLQLDTIRGEDSTGIFATNDKKVVRIVKAIGTPWDLQYEKNYDKIFRRENAALIGHNRAATKGKVTKQNAHPFKCGNLVGVHNGTLTSQYGLEDHQKFEVDSENIYHDMAIHGYENTLPKLNGAFALAWFNSEENTVNVVRNYQRPMSFTQTTDGKTLFFASEGWMLHVALGRCNIDHGEVKELTPGTLLKTSVPEVQPKDVQKLEVVEKKVDLYTYKSRQYYDYDDNVWRNKYGSSTTRSLATRPSQTGTNINSLLNQRTVERATTLQKYMGRSIKFRAKFVTNVTGRAPYFTGHMLNTDNNEPVNVRIYYGNLHRVEKLLRNNIGAIFSAKCSGADLSHGDLSILVSLDSIKLEKPSVLYSVDGKKDKKEKKEQGEVFAFGYLDQELTQQEYLDVTAAGCVGCHTIPQEDQRDELSWVSATEFFCHTCTMRAGGF